MIRTFAEHQVRKNQELSAKLWDFTPCSGEHAGKTYKLMVPGCWESHMNFAHYRGKAIYETNFVAEGNVRLVFKGVSHTANVKVITKNISSTDLAAEISFVLDEKEYEFSKQTMLAGEVCEVEQEFEFAGVAEWMMETPNLYLIQAKLVIDGQLQDDLIDQVGFREIKLGGKSILINGKRIRIKGYNRHKDHPHFGCALPYAAMVSDLYIIKDLGANSIRTSHYLNDELFLDLCDENGILVWEEHHARGFEEEQMRHPNFDKQCADCTILEEKIVQVYIFGSSVMCVSVQNGQ